MFKQIDYVMIMVSDMKRSVEFYRDQLGLRLDYESNEWTEFQTGQTKLALHGGGKPKVYAKDDVTKGNSSYAGTCSIGFEVDDLEEIFHQLKSKGVNFAMEPTRREGEGILKLAVCLDPDGLPISIAQPIREKQHD